LRHGQKGPSLVGDVLEVDKAERVADDVEQVAMLTRGGVGLIFNCT
jgi:hypothetical protein